MEKLENGRNASDELIRKYLNQQLSPSESQHFEEQLQNNPDLQARAELIRGLHQIHNQPTLVEAGSILLQLRAQKLASTLPEDPIEPSSSRYVEILKKPFVFIPIVLILAILISFFIIDRMDAKREQLFNDHLIAHPGMLNQPADPDDKLYNPVRYYQEKEWKKAAAAFRRIKDDELIYKFQYVVASINIPDKTIEDYQNDIRNLIKLKRELIEEDEMLHQLLVEWINFYIALIQIKQGNYKAGKAKIMDLKARESTLEPSLQEAVVDLSEQL